MLLPPLRSLSSAVECLQQEEALIVFQRTVWWQHCHNLVNGRVHERRNDVVERHAARLTLSIEQCRFAAGAASGLSRLAFRRARFA